MRELSTSIEIAATPQEVWQVWCDIERWPEWTPTVLSIEPMDEEALGLGSTVRIHQPKLRPAQWEVTVWEAAKRFAWVSTQPGVRTTADHLLTPSTDGCTATLSLRFDGLLGGIAGSLTRSLTTRYLALEASGLKARAEERETPCVSL